MGTLWPPGFGTEELDEIKRKLADLGLNLDVIKKQEDILKYNRKWEKEIGRKHKPKKAHGGKIKKYAKGGGVRKAARY